ncbi:hypothetical protein NQZ68_012117 [Scomber scombrus]|uniref:Uncharacterized protein n=1 Tax=Scomber scombrus TaxID=13677 RepID=A0AAV1N1I1_SCOSC
MADCSNYSVEEAGFDISALKTSLIQYFRCRSRPGDHCSLPPHISEVLQNSSPLSSETQPKYFQRSTLEDITTLGGFYRISSATFAVQY